jgi:hypothetical protein
MRKVQQFRQRARECRVSANRASTSELRRHYENLALVWDKLADERLTFFVQHHDSDTEAEVDVGRHSA